MTSDIGVWLMPFYYDLPMPAPESTSAVITLDQWLVDRHDRLSSGTAVALASVGETHFEVLANGDGIFGEPLVMAGSTVAPGESIAVVYADGESIPYGRPYSLARST